MEKILERLTALVGAISVFIVAASVSHEFGYFSYVGSFFQTFVTATDYFTNAILWFPITLFTALGWWNWDVVLKNPRLPSRKEWKTWIVPVLLIGLALLSFIFLPEGIVTLYVLCFFYFWLATFDKVLPAPNGDSLLLSEMRKLLKIAVMGCVGLFAIGYDHGRNDLKHNADPYIVRFKNSSEQALRVPLRNFDRGMLVRNPILNRVEFVKWENIESVIKISSSAGNPLSCRWWEIACKYPLVAP